MSKQFLCSYDQECQHFQERILPKTLNPEFSKPRNPLWYNRLEQAQTHVNSVYRSKTPQNPTLGQFTLRGSIHFVLISMQEWVHPTRNFSCHVKNRTKPTLGQFLFWMVSPFSISLSGLITIRLN